MKGCGYQGFEFGGGYLDSICIDGYLWDTDSGHGGDIPCPKCNPQGYAEYYAEDVEDQE